MALLDISLRSADRPQLGVDLPSPDRHLGVESDPIRKISPRDDRGPVSSALIASELTRRASPHAAAFRSGVQHGFCHGDRGDIGRSRIPIARAQSCGGLGHGTTGCGIYPVPAPKTVWHIWYRCQPWHDRSLPACRWGQLNSSSSRAPADRRRVGAGLKQGSMLLCSR